MTQRTNLASGNEAKRTWNRIHFARSPLERMITSCSPFPHTQDLAGQRNQRLAFGTTSGEIFQVKDKEKTAAQLIEELDVLRQQGTEFEKTAEARCKSQPLPPSTLDALSAHIVLLDHSGRILAVNAAWRDFAAANQLEMANDGVGVNYLEICQNASGDDAELAQAAAVGIREVMSNRRQAFYLEYPCHGPEERRHPRYGFHTTPLIGH